MEITRRFSETIWKLRVFFAFLAIETTCTCTHSVFTASIKCSWIAFLFDRCSDLNERGYSMVKLKLGL